VRSDVLLFLTILTDRVDLKWRTREDSNRAFSLLGHLTTFGVWAV